MTAATGCDCPGIVWIWMTSSFRFPARQPSSVATLPFHIWFSLLSTTLTTFNTLKKVLQFATDVSSSKN